MDPRYIRTFGTDEPSDEELERPHMWRFWRQLPPRGRMAIFDGSWYHWPIFQRAADRISNERFDQALDEVHRFEQMLIDEGALVLKFWMHLSKEAQRKRPEEAGEGPPDPVAGDRPGLGPTTSSTTCSRNWPSGPCGAPAPPPPPGSRWRPPTPATRS